MAASASVASADIANAPAPAGAKKPLARGPIVITSQSLTANQKEGTAFFKGSVAAKSSEMTLFSDTMKVYYAEDGSVSRMESEGNVKLIKGGQTVTSERAVYTADTGTVVFTGDPRAVEGTSIVTGDKIIYYVSEDRFIVEGSRVIIAPKPAGGGK